MREKIKEKWHLYLLFVRDMKLKIKQTTDNDRVMTIPKEINGARKFWVLAVIFSLHIIFLLQRNVRIKLITLYNMCKPFKNSEVLHELCTCANNY